MTSKRATSKRATAAGRLFGEQFTLARKRLGLKQEVVADWLGITYQQWQKYEKGTSRIPGEYLLEVARRLAIPLSLLDQLATRSQAGFSEGASPPYEADQSVPPVIEQLLADPVLRDVLVSTAESLAMVSPHIRRRQTSGDLNPAGR